MEIEPVYLLKIRKGQSHKYLIYHRTPKDSDGSPVRRFWKFEVFRYSSFLDIGHIPTQTTKMPYLLKDHKGTYDFIEPFVWNHFCYSFKRGGYSKAAMVSIYFKPLAQAQLMRESLSLNFISRMEK